MLFKVDFNPPGNAEDFKTTEIERHTLSYTDRSKRFYEVCRDFSKQYADIYSTRLNIFRDILYSLIIDKWSNNYKILKLCELRDKATTCVIIGTLFKLQQLKPSILKELSDQLEIIPQPPRTHFVHDSDSLVLEDELQRIKLVGDCINVHHVVTGVVCAVLGSEDEDGIFTVKDICFAGCGIQKPLPTLNGDRYIVLVSGLNMASKSADHIFSIHLLLEWLSGLTGTSTYQKELSKVVRVIIAGGLFSNFSNNNSLSEADLVDSLGSIDSFCAAVSSVVPLDLMPGCRDPCGIMLPQKAFHYCMFPKSVDYKSFTRVPNPYECDIGGFLCLGSSGEPIRDVMRCSNIDTEMKALRSTLLWGHIAPSCPDTAPCTPALIDPFIINDCPAVYFAGNCKRFDTDLYKGEAGQVVRLVCVPDFCETKTVALVNLANMECYAMTFT